MKQDIELQLQQNKAQTHHDKQTQLLETAEKQFHQKFAAATEFNQARETALAAFQARAEDMLAGNVQIKYQLDELADSFMIVENLDLDNNGVVDRAEFVKGFKEELDTTYDFLVLMFEDDAGAGADAVAKLHCEIREDHVNFSKALGESIDAAAAAFSQQVVADVLGDE